MDNLYLIRCNEYYKIGIATELQNRLTSLQTGNPYRLIVEACFQFPNAAIVEKVLHQKFARVRKLGEWFELGSREVYEFVSVCEILDGVRSEFTNELVNPVEIEEAEQVQETNNVGAKWDYAAMFADGWRMNVQDSRRLYWNWRKGSEGNSQTIYGGAIADLPYSIEDMRRIYRDGEKS